MKPRKKSRGYRRAVGRVSGGSGLAMAAVSALGVVAALLCLGLTQFSALAYLAQDGYAVAPDTLSKSLRNQTQDIIVLERADMGEAVYTRAVSGETYFIGEDKREISAGYPLFTQSGQVLYFLDDSLKMVTTQWETLPSYEGLRLSDGVTFNADRSQADIAEVALVQVNGGYQVARETTVTGAGRTAHIPMNAVCAFGEESILYYSYDRGVLSGASVTVAPGGTITVGENTYGYLDFLERLGLWARRETAVPPTTTATPRPTETAQLTEKPVSTADAAGSFAGATGTSSQQGIGEGGEDAAGETGGEAAGNGTNVTEGKPSRPAPEGSKPENTPTVPPQREPTSQPAPPTETPPPASDVVEKPAPPASGGGSTPAPPDPPSPPVDPNPGYVEPKVSFSEKLESWVYTVSVTAIVSDPANVLKGGVQIYIYEVGENGSEVQVLRRIITTSGTVALGQLKPNTEHHITASYKYTDKLGYPQSKTLEVGRARTGEFSELEPISLSFYDHGRTPAGGTAVEVYSNSLQMRNLVLDNIKNGTVTEVGGVTTHPNADPLKAETYINSFQVLAKATVSHNETPMVMDSAALRLLREGFTLSHWETPDALRSGTAYDYTITLLDRYGNQFGLAGDTAGSGNTCSQAPTVAITVPAKSNIAGSTLIQVSWKNPENAPIGPNPHDGVMGDKQIAGLYLVEKGKAVIPANAVELEGYPSTGTAANKVKGRFLPITVNSDGSVTNVNTGWVLTNLPVLTSYTAGVLCGDYNVDDNRTHYDETLKKTTDFLTASLSNLGTISYTAEVDELTQTTGRLKFRMNSADQRLLPLLDEVIFTVRQKNGGGEVQKLSLSRDELEKVPLNLVQNSETGRFEGVAEIELRLNDTADTVRAMLGFTAQKPPVPEKNTVWQYLLATAATTAKDDCWLTLTLGGSLEWREGETPGTLLELAPRTDYIGRFTTMANQGGTQEDVTSGSSKQVNFTTLSAEAQVRFSNAFVSTDFIELYDLSLLDLDDCILPDDADRGGKNVQVRVLDEAGVLVASTYINSAEALDSLRLSGLTRDKTYRLVFCALKYAVGSAGGVELNRSLLYETPQNLSEPYVYSFTTGESVVGDLSLSGINQLYRGPDGETANTLGILTATDFYTGVWQSGSSLYYYCDLLEDGTPDPTQSQAIIDRYLAQVEEKELSEVKTLATGETGKLTIRHIQNGYPNSTDTQKLLADCWTSRFIAVMPGEKYIMNCPGYSGYGRVTFYYKDTAGVLQQYTAWGNDYYFSGSVFAVPSQETTNNANADRICYMRISAYNAQAVDGLYLDRYDEGRTTEKEQLVTDELRISEGMALNNSNSPYQAPVSAYTADYIPVTSGSYYELTGRDPNGPVDGSQLGSNRSAGSVFFYNKDYVFIGRYDVSNQTSVIRAPFSAAYCRFNLMMSQMDPSGPTLDTSMLSMKLYLQAVQDRLQATVSTRLTDQSAAQLLRDGKYSVALYTTTSAVSDADDLSKQSFVPLGEPQTFAVGPNDMKDGKLDITQVLSFYDLTPGMGFMATLTISPAGWKGGSVKLSTLYFTTNRVVRTISTLADLKSVRNDPAGSYIVTADIAGMTGSILGSDRPFTGTIDFRGHTLESETGAPLFYRISAGGVVKNLVMNYNAASFSATAPMSSTAAVTQFNYGSLQNIILNYNPTSYLYGMDITHAGGLARYNHGVIDGFVVRLMKDVRVGYYVGLICTENYGVVSNGYVACQAITEPGGATRAARLEHVWKNTDGTVLSTNSSYVSLGVGINSTRGSISNVFAVGDVAVQSADASTDRSNADYKGSGVNANPNYETSTTGTGSTGVLVGSNQGVLRGAFATGDRLDHDPVRDQWSYMIDRGPAVGSVSGRYSAENLTYFSKAADPYSQYTGTDGTIAGFNVRGSVESLHDYQWYSNALGADGARFAIRDNVEGGFYPQLILPSCFGADVQPKVALPRAVAGSVEVQHNEVRLQGTREALVTVTLTFPYVTSGAQVTDFTVMDRNNVALDVEVLAQRAVENNYRVDLLLSLPESGAALPDSSYTITSVSWTGGSQGFAGQSGAQVIKASFWREIGSADDWKSAMVSPTSSIYGNYLLTADLDFSQSMTHSDWYCARSFYGSLDGGIYPLEQRELTTEAGQTIKDAAGAPRTIEIRGPLSGMHKISGVGNLGPDGKVLAGRDGNGRASLMASLLGTMKNLVFQQFQTMPDPDGRLLASVKSGYSGVVASAGAGAVLENCHVRESSFYGTTYLGALVGQANSTSLRGCSSRRVEITTYRPTPMDNYTVSVGGLVGYAANSVLEGCFAADATVRADDVYEANGVGGLVGYAGATTILNSYTTGLVDAGASRVGGVVGQLAGGSLTGCWSAASVMTVADFAGGVVGYHGDGKLTNNFTTSTVVTRSLAAGGVHRICSNTNYDEAIRNANYAFSGQYITYVDPEAPGKGESIYQFGVWDDADGATSLLSSSELCQSKAWSGVMGISDGYDLTGSAISGLLSGGSTVKAVEEGYLPKLVLGETGQLLYDQPDMEIGYVSTSVLSRVGIINHETIETFEVTLAIFSDRSDITTAPFGELADWESMAVTGAKVMGNPGFSGSGEIIAGVQDLGAYSNTSSDTRRGRAFSFKVTYGAAAGADGHYLDSYILSLPVYDGDGGVEQLQMRLSLTEPVYKIIYSVDEWDAFFSDPKYSAAYENVQIGWLAEGGNAGIIDFSAPPAIGLSHTMNVKVNRLSGRAKGGTSGDSAVYPTLSGLDVTFRASGQSLISQAVTEVSNLNFVDLKLSSSVDNGPDKDPTRYGGDMKGVIAQLQGNMKHVTFRNIVIDGGSSGYVGCVGRTYGTLEDIRMENIWVETNGSYVGGLVGYANHTAAIQKVLLTTTGGGRNAVCSRVGQQVGGLIGRLDGIASDLAIDQTDIAGNAFAGGVVGYAISNGGRPEKSKLEQVTVGDPTKANTVPGASPTPSVTVTLRPWATQTGTYALSYGGGAVGHANGQSLRNISVYDTKVGVYEKAGNDTLDDGSYNYYVGGVVGEGGGGMQSSLAKNCTVVSYGGCVGGLSGTSVSWYNTAQDCVVYALSERATRIGGAVGVGNAERSMAQHCVVSGNSNVGGLTGKATSHNRQAGAVDCVVLGRENVGGLAGDYPYHYLSRSYVTGSLNEAGATTMKTVVTADMLPDFLGGRAGSYQGMYIGGERNVGGITGRFRGVDCSNLYVNSGVTVEGKTGVGGLVGQYYGWSTDATPSANRSLAACASGGAVRGEDYVGGLVGQYTKDQSISGAATNKTADAPIPENFYGLVFTGSVECATPSKNIDLLIPGVLYDGTQLSYSRVYEGAALNGVEARNISGLNLLSYDSVMEKPAAADRGDVSKVLLATAENLSDTNLFFQARNTTYGGMGWSKSYWDSDVMQHIYTQSTSPATFAAYGAGVRDEDTLVLWLDARNNTGEGYMDPDAVTWKDLSKTGDNATLYWNNKKVGDGAFTIGERTNIMYWNEGALEFSGSNSTYYAQLEKSISPYLQSNYTVEVVYTYASPYYGGHNTLLTWRDGVTVGGFHAPRSIDYKHFLFNSYGANLAIGSTTEQAARPLLRTTTYAVEETDPAQGYGRVTVYQNGQEAGVSTSKTLKTDMWNTDSTVWRVGDGVYGSNSLRVSAIRVYKKTLTPEEVKRHADYDSWYYFGGAKPDGAAETVHTLTLAEDGTVTPAGSYKLLRSEDGGYNGALVTEAYTGGGLGSRGYYYLADGAGNVSNVVQKQGLTLGPALKTESLANEYFGTAPYKNVRGQEGERLDGTLHNINDRLYYGGMILPEAQPLKRDGTGVSAIVTMEAVTLQHSALPELTVYASGADRVNLELRGDTPDGLAYAVEVDGTAVLAGLWPTESRTLTMTWDFQTSFTLRLTLDEEERESEWSASTLAGTVMTWGDGYWYLCDGVCYGSGGPLPNDGPFVHMRDGLLLDSGGTLWRASDGAELGEVIPFTLTEPQPVWSGSVAGAQVASFGTYLLSEGGTRATQLVVKGDRAYTMPVSGVAVGGFVADSYGGRVYTTILGSDGTLCDMGDPIRCPEEFSNSGIREISNTLDYNGHIVLVRYRTGQLVAFDYLTGESVPVVSGKVEQVSLTEFLLASLRKLGRSAALTGARGQALAAVDYQAEVEADPSLSTALKELKAEDIAAQGPDGEPVAPAGTEGLFDGPGGDGTGGGEIEADGAGTESGRGTVSDGGQAVDGGNMNNGPAEEPTADGAESPGTPGETAQQPDKTETGAAIRPDQPEETAQPAQTGEPAEAVPNADSSETDSAGQAPSAGAQTVPQTLKTQYVTVYNPESGVRQVYDLEELVKKPDEELVTQEARAEQLEAKGFTTSLRHGGSERAPAVGGQWLILLVGVSAAVLLVGLSLLKRRKLDGSEE